MDFTHSLTHSGGFRHRFESLFSMFFVIWFFRFEDIVDRLSLPRLPPAVVSESPETGLLLQSSTSKAEGCLLPQEQRWGNPSLVSPQEPSLKSQAGASASRTDLGETPAWQMVMEQEEPGRAPGSQLHLDRWGPAGGTTCRSETGQDPSVGPTCPGPALTLVGSGDPSQGCISTQQLLGNTKYVERGQRGGSLGRKPWG